MVIKAPEIDKREVPEVGWGEFVQRFNHDCSVLTVAAMTGKVAVPYGAAVFLVPELAAMMQQAPPVRPASKSSGNGDA